MLKDKFNSKKVFHLFLHVPNERKLAAITIPTDVFSELVWYLLTKRPFYIGEDLGKTIWK